MGDDGGIGIIFELLGVLVFGGLILLGVVSAASHIAEHLSVVWR